MSERTPSPELPPLAAHNLIDHKLRTAADDLWTPGTAPGTFTTARSAACLELAAEFPPARAAQDAPRLTITLREPSRRFHDAMEHAAGTLPRSHTALFVVLDPQEAEAFSHKGVHCRLTKYGFSEPVFEDELPYDQFLHLIERAGVCEPANRRQRMARWALEAFDAWAQNEERLKDVYRRPPFGIL